MIKIAAMLSPLKLYPQFLGNRQRKEKKFFSLNMLKT